jgi:hypothetical protein
MMLTITPTHTSADQHTMAHDRMHAGARPTNMAPYSSIITRTHTVSGHA